jgi:hypothetical protein
MRGHKINVYVEVNSDYGESKLRMHVFYIIITTIRIELGYNWPISE